MTLDQATQEGLVIAFAQAVDEADLSYEEGLDAAENLADRLQECAEDRASFARRDG